MEKKRMEYWLGFELQETEPIRRYWVTGRTGALPASTSKLTCLRGRKLNTLLTHWTKQWEKEGVANAKPEWEDHWEKLDKEDKNTIIKRIQDGHSDIPEYLREKFRQLEDSNVLTANGELIGNYCFWVYFYKGPGKFRRTLAEGKNLLNWLGDRWGDLTDWWKREPRQSLYGIFAQSLLVVFLVGIMGKYSILSAIPMLFDDRQTEIILGSKLATVLMGVVLIIIGSCAWILFVERPLKQTRESSQWYHMLYALPVALRIAICFTTRFLPEQAWIWALILTGTVWSLFLISLLLPYKWTLPREWDWFRLLVVMLPIVGIMLLWSLPQLASLLLDWLSISAFTFIILRLWWLALEHRRRTLDSVIDPSTEPIVSGRLAKWLSKLMGFAFEDLKEEDTSSVFLTFLTILLLILGHLLWLHQQASPVHTRIPEDQGSSFITIIHPPFVSTDDMGDVHLSVSNPTTQTLSITLTLSCTLDSQMTNTTIPSMAVWLDGESIKGEQFDLYVPPMQTIHKPLVLQVLPLGWTNDVPSTIGISVDATGMNQPEFIPVPIISRLLPRIYASSNSLLAWLFGLAWGIAQVVAAGFLAMRGNIPPFSRQENSAVRQSVTERNGEV